jgi:aldehyde:ferredoxin oxidoreductase
VADFGYAGKILKVNLSNQTMTREDTSNYTGKYLVVGFRYEVVLGPGAS